MSYPDMFYRIALTMLQDIGAITAKKLVAYTGSAKAVFTEKRSNLLKIPGIGNHLATRIVSGNIMKDAEMEMEYIQKKKISALYFLDENYPERLKHCIDGPVMLYLRGENCLSESKILSIVGTRQASEQGKAICRDIIQELGSRYKNLVIVSGLAYGIDITAHQSALANNIKTAAVLGHGLKTIYPYVHAESAKRISEKGALVTDFSSGVKPERNNFIRRNRIIAGLSEATLVIESGKKGGALITADIAMSYDREVMTVPGRPSDQFSSGCNDMIKRNMASLVENSNDIEYILGWESKDKGVLQAQLPMVTFSDEERRIIEAIHHNSELVPETIGSITNIPIQRVLSLLIEMELRGWLTPLPGNVFRLKVRP